ILLFLNELLYKTIQEETLNPELFRFIFDHLALLDKTEENPANFHLLFSLHLTHFLGFFPQGACLNDNTVFDMGEGHFSQGEALPAENFITGRSCDWFSKLLAISPGNFHTVAIPSNIRSELLEKILRYYHMHLPLTGEFKSHIILHDVLQK
ncbi:MAG: DNA repair protein RecO C-terminal domain-containing protein, partial [Bacteroidales bacterium]|nr:DNA repair protein RecO C-terminal domain-containing protein [Bacteroidales bacterium]